MLKQAQALSDKLIRLRRDLHAHPELSFQELRTAAVVADTLRTLEGFVVHTGVGKTGVVGELGSGNGPTIAIRADMDALPIQEQTGALYASTHPGMMHACGHDAHTTMLLGVAMLLHAVYTQGELRGRVRLLFQPAEETTDDEGISGAQRMIAAGALDGVDAAIALHIAATEPAGHVAIHPGYTSAAVDAFAARILASGGHGAYPHQGTDPLWMLIPVLSALHGIVARRIDPHEPAVLSLGQIHAGTASNIIPTEVYLNGTLRSYAPDVRQQLLAEVERALAVARALGGDYRLEIDHGYPPVHNDATVAGWIEQTALDMVGDECINRDRRGMGGEDFAYMCQRVPGAMFFLGAALEDGVQRAHHTPIFDIDERMLPLGSALLAETARRFLMGGYTLS